MSPTVDSTIDNMASLTLAPGKYGHVPIEFAAIKTRYAQATNDLRDIRQMYLLAIEQHHKKYPPSQECPVCSEWKDKVDIGTIMPDAILDAVGLILGDAEVDIENPDLEAADGNISIADEFLVQVEDMLVKMKAEAPVHVLEGMIAGMSIR